MDSFTNFTYKDFEYLMQFYQESTHCSDSIYAVILLSINEGINPKEKEKIINSLKKIFKNWEFPKKNTRENIIAYIES